MTKGSCGKEPDECESLMSGSEVAAGEGILLPTITVGRRNVVGHSDPLSQTLDIVIFTQ
jgi:hypothetical protein